MRIRGSLVAAIAVSAACAACGKTPQLDDARPRDAAGQVDGAISAGPPGSELSSGGGRVSGGTMTLDVQIGHPVDQRPATGGGLTVEGDTAIKP